MVFEKMPLAAEAERWAEDFTAKWDATAFDGHKRREYFFTPTFPRHFNHLAKTSILKTPSSRSRRFYAFN